MTDPFETRLQRAGRVMIDDAATQRAMAEAVARARPGRASHSPRRIARGIALGGVLVLAAPVAVAAAGQVGAWLHVPDPDLVVARSYTDVDGTPLGSCETRLALEELPADVRADFAAYVADLDVAAIEPNPETVAASLSSVGRLEDIGRLIEGARPSDFNVTHHGELLLDEPTTDARAMQQGVLLAIGQAMAADLGSTHPDVYDAGLRSLEETHCTAASGATRP